MVARISLRLKESETTGGNITESDPTSLAWKPKKRPMSTASPTPISGAGACRDTFVDRVAATMTVTPRISGTARISEKCSRTTASCPKPEPAARVSGEATPNIMSSCDTNIIPPMPQEKPVTTAYGTLAM